MTAQDLLIEYLDYSCFWSTEEVKNDEPAVIRRKQLESLLQAFGLTKAYVNPLKRIMYGIAGRKEEVTRAQYLDKLSTIDYFSHGEFLHDREYEENKELIDFAIRAVRENYPTGLDRFFEGPVDIDWLFNDLIRFRKEIYKITYPWGGMMEGFSVGLHYSKILSAKLKKLINQNTHEIDEILCLVIDPKKRTFTKEELINIYGYPDVDIDAIDSKWQMDNY